MYHHQQNKWYSQRCLLPNFEATLNFSRGELLAHNNISQICYLGQISLQSVAVNCSFPNNNPTPSRGTIYFAVDGTYYHHQEAVRIISLHVWANYATADEKEEVSSLTRN